MDKESVIVDAVYKNIGMFVPFLDTFGSPDLRSSTADLVARKFQITVLWHYVSCTFPSLHVHCVFALIFNTNCLKIS
jgi:hypothetical protein